MIRIIDREIVRERSYAFPADSSMPQVASTLPPRLRRDLPPIEDGPEDLLFLRFFLQSRVASIHTRSGAIAWDANADCRLQLRHAPTGSLYPRLNLQPTSQTTLAATLIAADGWQSGGGRNGPNGQQAERLIEHGTVALPGLQGGGANERSDNGEYHSRAESKLAYSTTVDESSRNGESGQLGHGYVLLGILEPGSASPHAILTVDTYSVALVGRFRLLAETIAVWMGIDTEIVSAS